MAVWWQSAMFGSLVTVLIPRLSTRACVLVVLAQECVVFVGIEQIARSMRPHWEASDNVVSLDQANHGKGLTSVISKFSGRMSGRDSCRTKYSSSALLATTKTTKPLLSRSSESDLVKGKVGDPATTTTSCRPPLRARLARRVLRLNLLPR